MGEYGCMIVVLPSQPSAPSMPLLRFCYATSEIPRRDNAGLVDVTLTTICVVVSGGDRLLVGLFSSLSTSLGTRLGSA